MNLELPPERRLDSADRMLTEILATPVRSRRRASGPVLVLVAAALVVAVVGGLFWFRPDPPIAGGPTTATTPTMSTVPTSSSTPASSPPSTPSSEPTTPKPSTSTSTPAVPGAHTVGDQVDFTYFSTRVIDVREDRTARDGWFAGVEVEVCVLKMGPEPVNGKTRISADRWQLSTTDKNAPGLKDGFEGKGPWTDVLGDKTYAEGDCARGVVTFLVPSPDADWTKINYSNSYGEKATWTS